MSEILCKMPGCQTTAGCQCRRLNLVITKEWFEKRAAAEGDIEISAGLRGPPPAYNVCVCSCHRGSGIIHFFACCSPAPQKREE